MKKSTRLMFVLATAAALTAGTSTAAFAARDYCSGTYEIDGCEYCSYNGSATSYGSWNCDGGYSGYYWAGCSVWVSGNCIGGTFFATDVNA